MYKRHYIKNNVWTPTCGIFLVNTRDEILIVHPTRSVNLSIPKWQLEEGETTWEAAIRELKEETNIDINKINIIKNIPLDAQKYTNKRKTLHPFLIITDSVIDIKKLKCTTYVMDKVTGEEKYPENDKFYMLNIHDRGNDVFSNRLHYTQLDTVRIVRDLL